MSSKGEILRKSSLRRRILAIIILCTSDFSVNCHCPEVCGDWDWSSKLASSSAAPAFCKPQVRETDHQLLANVRRRAARYPLLEARSDRYAAVARQDGHRDSRLAFVGGRSSTRGSGDS
jgi:hypothetical protein